MRALIAAGAAFLFAGASLEAQDTTNGALFLLLPVGAQTVGMGQATVAERLGSESIWSNPSAIGAQTKSEVAIHHSETIAARGDVVSVVLPKKGVGAFALSVNLLDFGNQEITDQGGTPVGLVLPRDVLFAGTFGTSIRRASFGVSLKRLQYRVDCSGQCSNVSTFSANATAIDLGAQLDVPGDSAIRVGFAVRNLGSRLQVNEQERAAALPSRIELGLSYAFTSLIAKYVSDVDLRADADVLANEHLDHPAAKIGADLIYQKTVHFRGGYLANDTDGAKAAVGFGLATGRLLFDIARTFGGLSEDAGKTPTYVSLRFTF